MLLTPVAFVRRFLRLITEEKKTTTLTTATTTTANKRPYRSLCCCFPLVPVIVKIVVLEVNESGGRKEDILLEASSPHRLGFVEKPNPHHKERRDDSSRDVTILF